MEMNDMRTLVKELSDPAVRRRLDTLREMVISIGKRNGWVHDGMTREQALEVTFSRIGETGAGCVTEKPAASERDEDTSQIDHQNHTIKEIRIRLCWDDWQRIYEEARKLHTSHTSLAHKWILESLKKTKD